MKKYPNYLNKILIPAPLICLIEMEIGRLTKPTFLQSLAIRVGRPALTVFVTSKVDVKAWP